MDADYGGSLANKRSTTGYCVFLGGNMVSWRSKKQGVVAISSGEAEFRAMALGVGKLLWFQIVQEDLKIPVQRPIELLCTNQSAIMIAHNPIQYDRTKYIEIDRHFLKKKSLIQVSSKSHMCHQGVKWLIF